MTRFGGLVARALVLALLLLSLSGNLASADPGNGHSQAPVDAPSFFPDDPGYVLQVLPDDPGYALNALPDDPGYEP